MIVLIKKKSIDILFVLGGTIPQWITPEVLNMFLFHELRPLSANEEMKIVQNLVGFSIIFIMLNIY